MKRVDIKSISIKANECCLSIVLRNEASRLPYLFSYYRKLGVRHFFATDNGSSDGSLEFLLAQPDCYVFRSEQAYADAKFGASWHQHIIDNYGNDNWWVIADADELLVYPDCERVSISEFCQTLEAEGASALYAVMLDMYSRAPISDAVCVPGQDFIEICPYFDVDYKFRARYKAPFAPAPFPPIEPIGGPRLRLFYPEYANKGEVFVAFAKAFRKFTKGIGKFGLNLKFSVAVPPVLFKIPLFKFRPGVEVISSHVVCPVRLSSKTGALLHFKFFSDFHERALMEKCRGAHYDGASEYARYARVLDESPDLSLYCDKSAFYLGSDQLISLGIISRS